MATCECTNQNGLSIVRLKGSLDGGELDQVEQPFEAATHCPGARCVVDLTGVDMVTTPALSMFIAAAKYARQSGGRLVFTESQPPVRDVLSRLRLFTILDTVTGIDEAIRHARE